MSTSRRLPAGFLGPWWLERQRELAGNDFAPTETSGDLNRTHRDAVLVGNLDGRARLEVDPRGLVVGPSGTWSLDWWIGGEERWHLPSRDAGVRQELVGGAPVVTTAVRVPGGDAIQRVFAVEAVPGLDGPVAVVEIENASPVPFAVALAIRPYGLRGVGRVGEVAYADGAVLVDGNEAVRFQKEPARFAFGTAFTDSADLVTCGAARDEPPTPAPCPEGLAQGAFVFPLPHTAVLRAFLPLDEVTVDAGPAVRPSSLVRIDSSAVPRAETVAKGWDAHADRGARIHLPDPKLRDAIDAARRGLLLARSGDAALGEREGDHPAAVRSAETRRAERTHDVVAALQELGFGDDAADDLLAIAAAQESTGQLGATGATPSGAAALVAHGSTLGLLARQLQLTPEPELAAALAETAVAAGLWTHARTNDRGRRLGRRRAQRWPDLARPDGARADDTPDAPSFASQFWTLHGLDALAELFEDAAQHEAASDARSARDALTTAVREAIDASLGSARLLPSAPDRPFDADAVANLVVAELALVECDQAWFARLVEHVATTTVRGAVPDPSGHGLSPRETIRLARAELRAGQAASMTGRLSWLAAVGPHPGWWPTTVNPRTGGGSAGQPADLGVSAAILLLARELAVGEHAKGLDLLRVYPDAWLGQNLEVHGLPTRWGSLSYAIRWHGERPALLWELDQLDSPGVGDVGGAAGAVEFRCPGLDPNWSSSDRSGEALLSPVEPRGDEVGDESVPASSDEVDSGAAGGTGQGSVGVSLRVASPTRKPSMGDDQ